MEFEFEGERILFEFGYMPGKGEYYKRVQQRGFLDGRIQHKADSQPGEPRFLLGSVQRAGGFPKILLGKFLYGLTRTLSACTLEVFFGGGSHNMAVKTIQIGGETNPLDEMQAGDMFVSDVTSGFPMFRQILVTREVPIEPFVPDPAVWRSTGTPNGAAPIQNRQNLDVHNPESGGWTRYVRKDED